MLQFLASFANRIEMLRRIEADQEKRKSFREVMEGRDEIIQRKEEKILTMKEEAKLERLQKLREIDQLKLSHSLELDQLQSQVSDLKTENNLLKDESDSEVKELKAKAIQDEIQIKNFQQMLEREKEVAGKIRAENQDLQSRVFEARASIDSLDCTNLELKDDILVKEGEIARLSATISRKDSEIEAKTKALSEKDAIISGMSEKLTRVREYLAGNKQVCRFFLKHP